MIDFSVWIFAFNLCCVLCSLTWPFLICYFATMATNCMASIGNNAYDLNWYNLPTKLQKFIILIILRFKQPPHFTGLNLIQCKLENFGKVIKFLFTFNFKNECVNECLTFLQIIKSSCSYYMIFRANARR